MMDLDSVSNCSSLSLHSEETKSNESTLSGLSTYQDEFAELRHLVNPKKYPSCVFSRCSTPKQNVRFEYREKVSVPSLSNHLEDSRQIQEKYKLDLYNLEKSLELKFYDKVEKLLKTNRRLQTELDSANEQIARLLKNYSKQKIPSLDQNFIQLEQKYHDLTLKYSKLQHDYFQNKQQNEEYEIENKELKIELSELKIDIDAKNGCIMEFKDKISEQYVENETLLKSNFKLSQIIDEISSELTYIRKTQNWYKERLQLCQSEKQILSDEILKCKADLCSQHEKNEILNVELSKSKAQCEMVELKALKDKEKLYKQLDSINLSNDSKISQTNLNFTDTKENETCLVNFYESSIQDLTHEIGKIKEYVQQQDSMIQKIAKENSELIARCITLQKTIQRREVTIEELEIVKKQLHSELDDMRKKIKQKSNEIIVKENQVLSLQAELRARKEEQQTIEQTVKTIRDQFAVFKYKYRDLSDELNTKNKQILQIENEKQKLFMNNNWNICELQKLKEKDIVINQLKDDLKRNNETLNEYLGTIETVTNEMNRNQEKNLLLLNEKQTTIDREYLEIRKYEDVLTQYKNMVINYEKEISDLKQLLNDNNINVVELKDNIKILKDEVNKKDINIKELRYKCTALESELKLHSENVTTYEIISRENKNCDAKDLNNAIFLQNNQTSLDKNSTSLQGNYSGEIYCDKQKAKKSPNPSISSLKKKLGLKFIKVEDRIKRLNVTCHQCSATLNNILNIVKDNDKEQVQNLNILLQVKDLELKEKQKKYEANNRTLLRKVKEHMKGRNAAEKHNKYLQEMYNSLSDENNSLKLQVNSKEDDIENLKRTLDRFTNINEKLKISLSKLEEQKCEKCILLTKRIESLEKLIEDLENKKLSCQDVLLKKEDIVVNLQNEVQHLLQTNVSLNRCNKQLRDETTHFVQEKEGLCNTVKALENEIIKLKSQVDELNATLKQEKNHHLEITMEKNSLKNSIDQMNSQIEYLSNEIKISNSRLHMKSEELRQLEDNKSKMETSWLQKQKDVETVISTLKHYMHEMQLEISTVKNEKYFLQRLCNDLKLALKSHANQNKLLQQQLNAASKEHDFNSLPNVLPNVPCDSKYDDDYINQLLQQNRAPLRVKPVTEMKSCLDTLKREISTLQEQIARKNIQY